MPGDANLAAVKSFACNYSVVLEFYLVRVDGRWEEDTVGPNFQHT